MIKLVHTSHADWSDVLERSVIDRVTDGQHKFLRQENWSTEVGGDPPEGYDLLYRGNRSWGGLWNEDSFVAYVTGGHSNNEIYVKMSGNDETAMEAFLNTLKNRLKPTVLEKGTIIVNFWTLSTRGPTSVKRKIDAPPWSELAGNYHSLVEGKMDHLVHAFKPSHGGQLLLWHGPPGTGKTYALRALAREWIKWCSPEYIVDPEKFFGSDASYMMQVLLENPTYSPYAYEDDEDEEEDENRERWRLLIFEDAGEFLSADAHERAGQGLSRLLNTVDGLIGQGLKVLILITTNEELSSLHAAVSRPGRAAVKIPFAALEAAEAASWADSHGLVLPTEKQYTLSELYALRDGFFESDPTVKIPSRLGFSRPLTATPA